VQPAYLSWEELADPDESAHDTESVPVDASALETNPRLSQLSRERARIEQRLMELLGKAPPSGEKARDAARFPMPIHTAESRLADRKNAREQDLARAAARRAAERARIAAAEVASREQAKKQYERLLIQAQAQRRKDASARQERHGDWLRALHAQDAMHARWAEQRSTALRAGSETKRRTQALFEQHSQDLRERALSRRREQREAEAALMARLDRRQQRDHSLDSRPRAGRQSGAKEF